MEMNLDMIGQTLAQIQKMNFTFSVKEKEFMLQFAFKTGDKELVNSLTAELRKSDGERQTTCIMEKYKTMYDAKPQWVDSIENLLVAIELYRLEEEKAANRLADLLNAYGITIGADERKRFAAKVAAI